MNRNLLNYGGGQQSALIIIHEQPQSATIPLTM